jgi:hypothetical protein
VIVPEAQDSVAGVPEDEEMSEIRLPGLPLTVNVVTVVVALAGKVME